MKRFYILLFSLMISEWSLSQNAGGMITRPKTSKGSNTTTISKNRNSQVILADKRFFRYDYVGDFQDGMAEVTLNGKHGYIDSTGCEVISCKYDDARSFSEGLAFVELNGEWKCINKLERKMFSYNNSSLYFCFNEGLTKVSQNGKWGFINQKGDVVIPLKYDDAILFREGLASVKRNGSWGYIDKTGHEVIPFIHCYPNGDSFHEGLATICRNNKWGYINKRGKEVIPCKYINADYFSDGVAWARFSNDNNDWVIIDKTGREVIAKHGIRNPFSEGMASVTNSKGKYGFIDKTGHVVIPFKYDDARPFNEGLSRIIVNHKYGFIDKLGHVVIPCKYENASSFSEGFAAVKLGGKWGFIDKTGKPLKLKDK